MRNNGTHSKRGGRNDARRGTSTSSTSSGHGADGSRGTGDGKVQPTSVENGSEPLKILFEPIDEDECLCSGGVCPVPWATETFTSGDSLDIVNHPPHYTKGDIECIEAIETQLTREEYRGYLKGKIAEYNWSEKHKGGIEDLKKAQWHLNRLVDLQ